MGRIPTKPSAWWGRASGFDCSWPERRFSQAARKHLPDSDIQRCVVHLQRDLLSKVRPKDKAEFSRDIKEAFNNFDKSSSQELAQEKLRLLALK